MLRIDRCGAAVAALVLLMTLPLPAPAAPAQPPNPGFESGLEGWTVSPGSGLRAEAVAEAAALGRRGLRLERAAPGSPGSVACAPAPASPGAEYVARFWARRRGPNAGLSVRLHFAAADGTALPPAPAGAGRPAASIRLEPWFDRYELRAVAPPGAHAVAVRIEAPAGPGIAADFDDFSLGAASPGETPPPDPAPWLAAASEPPAHGFAAPAIVLKLDDLKENPAGGVDPRWARTADFLAQRRIKATIGVIGNLLERAGPDFCRWIAERRDAGALEFWHHGYDHAEWKAQGRTVREFAGTSLAHQRRHLEIVQQIAREKLGFVFDVFGAPFNATDDHTIAALEAEPAIRVWLYGDPQKPAGKIVLARSYAVNIEQPVLVPSYARFLEGYAHNRGQRYFVLQGHPVGWNDEQFAEFARIVEFLLERKARFLFATELAAELPRE